MMADCNHIDRPRKPCPFCGCGRPDPLRMARFAVAIPRDPDATAEPRVYKPSTHPMEHEWYRKHDDYWMVMELPRTEEPTLDEVNQLRLEVRALRAAGDALQSAYSRLAEYINALPNEGLFGDDPPDVPYEVTMDAVGYERLVDAWTEARRGS